MEVYRIVIGVLLIMYGIFKICLAMATLFLPKEHHVPFGFLLKDDHTLAGIMLDIVLLLFGIYTIAHGLALLELIYTSVGDHLNSREFNKVVYALFGVFLLVFYTIVTTTHWIKKDPTQDMTYRLVGIGGGLLFLLGAVGINAWDAAYAGQPGLHMWIAAALVLLFAFIALTVFALRTRKRSDRSLRGEIVSLAMIPLGTVG